MRANTSCAPASSPRALCISRTVGWQGAPKSPKMPLAGLRLELHLYSAPKTRSDRMPGPAASIRIGDVSYESIYACRRAVSLKSMPHNTFQDTSVNAESFYTKDHDVQPFDSRQQEQQPGSPRPHGSAPAPGSRIHQLPVLHRICYAHDRRNAAILGAPTPPCPYPWRANRPQIDRC